jgi:hypothetical protein
MGMCIFLSLNVLGVSTYFCSGRSVALRQNPPTCYRGVLGVFHEADCRDRSTVLSVERPLGGICRRHQYSARGLSWPPAPLSGVTNTTGATHRRSSETTGMVGERQTRQQAGGVDGERGRQPRGVRTVDATLGQRPAGRRGLSWPRPVGGVLSLMRLQPQIVDLHEIMCPD